LSSNTKLSNQGQTLTIDGEPYRTAFTEDQLELFYGIPEHIYYIVCQKGRRFGGTHGAAKFCIEQMIQGKKILWVDVIQSNLEAYHELFFYPELKKFRKKFWSHNKTRHTTKLLNGSITFKSAEKPEGMEGFQYDIIILNESGIILKGIKGRNMWQNSILPMTLQTKEGKTPLVYFIGTPKGRKSKKDEKHISKNSLYFELSERGKSKHEKYYRWLTLEYSTYDNPLLTEEDIEALENEIPKEVRDQELKGKFIDANNESIFRKVWFPIVESLPQPEQWQRLIIVGDTAFKAKEYNDNSAFGLILEHTTGYLIIDSFFGKYEFPELCARVKEFYNFHNLKYFDKSINYVCIEDKASGQSLIQTLQRETNINVKALQVKGDKIERANNIVATCECGRVSLLKGAWNEPFLSEVCDFNAAMDTPDDNVDWLTHGIGFLQSGSSGMKVGTSKVKKRSRNLSKKGYYG
jgi:predicted phage terminase large subunit-like protein